MLATNQLMKRSLDGFPVTQRTKDKFFNATDLLSYYNEMSGQNKRFKDFWENQGTKSFCEALNQEILNGDNSAHLEILETTRGRGGATWMHPYLFVKFAMWLSPVFEVKVIKWVYDNLIEFRHDAGDHYKEMCKAISETYINWKGKTPDPLVFSKEINYLNFLVFGNTASNQRNTASESQLMLMNKLQKLNTNLILKSTDARIRRQKLAEFAEMIKITE